MRGNEKRKALHTAVELLPTPSLTEALEWLRVLRLRYGAIDAARERDAHHRRPGDEQ